MTSSAFHTPQNGRGKFKDDWFSLNMAFTLLSYCQIDQPLNPYVLDGNAKVMHVLYVCEINSS
jgi:hypothetical protein